MRTHQRLQDFARSTSGAIAPLFGLLMLAMAFLIGVSIDGARSTRTATMAGSALDAAALAGARALRLEDLTDSELTSLVSDFFYNNLTDNDTKASVSSVSVVSDRETNSVKVTANLKVKTTASAVFGKDYIPVKVNSTAVFDAKDVEVSMMLDVSGSMDGDKIRDLRAAAKDLVEIMLPEDKPHHNRVAIAPFSTSVNSGSLRDGISVGVDGRGRSQPGRNTNCVTERTGSAAFTDAAPAANKLNRKATFCPAAAVLPLTNVVDDLEDTIDSLRADGMTAGHLGIAWSFYLLSPNWRSVFPPDNRPAEYSDEKIQKVAILMTDGMFNSTYESANGTSVAQSRNLCDNMKRAGITIFTVGFQVPADVVPTLKYCASSDKHYYSAADGAQLRATFKDIANRLNGLRIAS